MSTSHVSSSLLPTPYGTFDMHGFVDSEMGKEHLVLSMGVLNDGATVLTRLHSECLTGDALFSLRCDCGSQLQEALKRIAKEGRGAVVLVYHPETAEDVDNNIEMIANPGIGGAQSASDVVYQQVGTGSQILMDLGVHKMRLMSAPFKFSAISGFDLEVV